MPRPWTSVDARDTPDGRLELRRRGERDWMILVGGRVLMTSMLHESEVRLATLACAALADRRAPRVLTAGLGLGFTLRALLDGLPRGARVVVAELNPIVVEWCRGPVADVAGRVLDDPRVELHVGDVMRRLRDASDGTWDGVVLDLYVGPGACADDTHALYGPAAVRAVAAKLAPGGVYTVWGERPEPAFVARLQGAGLATDGTRPPAKRERNMVFVARKPA